MYLIDTNIVIWILRGEETYLKVQSALKNESSLYISTLTIAEIYQNTFPQEIIKTDEVLSGFEFINVTSNIAKQGGFYWQQFVRRFKNLSLIDCLIAATAKEHKLTLVTLNSRHFPMDDIKLLDPVKK